MTDEFAHLTPRAKAAVAQLRFDGLGHQAIELDDADLVPAAAALLVRGYSVPALLKAGHLPGSISRAGWYRFRAPLIFVAEMIYGAQGFDYTRPDWYGTLPRVDDPRARVALMACRQAAEGRRLSDDLTPSMLGRVAIAIAAGLADNGPAALLDAVTNGDRERAPHLNAYRGFHAAVLSLIAGASSTPTASTDPPSPPAT